MSQGIGLNPGGVHHHAGLPAVFAAIGSEADGSTDPPLCITLELGHAAGRLDLCSGVFGGEGQEQIEAGVIELPIAVGHAPIEAWLQLRQCITQLLL